jgi:hypothetical protein
MAIKYIENFFEEKEIPEVMFEIEGASGINYIPNTVVIEHIKIAPTQEQQQIANVLRKIDFFNGDVNDFLKHLAGALAI